MIAANFMGKGRNFRPSSITMFPPQKRKTFFGLLFVCFRLHNAHRGGRRKKPIQQGRKEIREVA